MSPPHPFDPLDGAEIETAISVVKKAHGDGLFKSVSLQEPPKADMQRWLADQSSPRPARVADVIYVDHDGKAHDGLVDVGAGTLLKWEYVPGVQPIVRETCKDCLSLSIPLSL